MISRKNFLKIFGATVIGGLFLDVFLLEKLFFKVSSVTVKKDGIKVVQVSDLHLQRVSFIHRVLADRILKLEPKLLLFTGDSIDSKDKLDELDQFLSLFPKSFPKAAVLGNWEYWGQVDLQELKKVYAKHNCDLLINQGLVYRIGKQEIPVVGVDDYVGGQPDLERAMHDVKNYKEVVVMSHCPEFSETIDDSKFASKVKLVLSGHTHGGQVNILGFVPFKPRGSGIYLKGMYELQNMKMYVSSGIGTSILPVRLGARAEVVVHHI